MILTAGNFRRTALNIYAFLVLRKNGETAVLAVVGATTAFFGVETEKKEGVCYNQERRLVELLPL